MAAAVSTGPTKGGLDSLSNYNTGYDFQGAYAISDHFAIQGAYYSRRERDLISWDNNIFVSSDVRYRRSGWELGGSYFVPMDRGAISFFHIDAGFGLTKNGFTDNGWLVDTSGAVIDYSRAYKDKQLRIFAQPGLYTGRRAVQFGTGFRFQWSQYNNVITDYSQVEKASLRLGGLKELFTVEPYMILRFGPSSIPGLRLEFQSSFNFASADRWVRGWYVSMGVVVDPLSFRLKQ